MQTKSDCLHDHHITRHVEVNCSPVGGQSDLYSCVHKLEM
jgi:hypothetical protein